MEKYGFVYLWRDRKHKRYYIGSHWGTEDDGYVCSSNWMQHSYRRRPEDFKRRVISRIYTNRYDLLKKEESWISLIKTEEIKIRYYNLTKRVNFPSANPEQDAKKQGNSMKIRWADPSYREKMTVIMSNSAKKRIERYGVDQLNEARKKNTHKFMQSEEYKQLMREKRLGYKFTEETIEKIRQKALINKDKTSEYFKSSKWWNNGIQNRRTKECPGEGWISGRCKINAN